MIAYAISCWAWQQRPKIWLRILAHYFPLPPGLVSSLLASHHPIFSRDSLEPIRGDLQESKISTDRSRFRLQLKVEAFGCGESWRLVLYPLRPSVALSRLLKMSTKALAAIAKVKSEHILKVTMRRKSLFGLIFGSLSFVYFLEYSVFRIKAKGNRPSPRRHCFSKVRGNTNERPFDFLEWFQFRKWLADLYNICSQIVFGVMLVKLNAYERCFFIQQNPARFPLRFGRWHPFSFESRRANPMRPTFKFANQITAMRSKVQENNRVSYNKVFLLRIFGVRCFSKLACMRKRNIFSLFSSSKGHEIFMLEVLQNWGN